MKKHGIASQNEFHKTSRFIIKNENWYFWRINLFVCMLKFNSSGIFKPTPEYATEQLKYFDKQAETVPSHSSNNNPNSFFTSTSEGSQSLGYSGAPAESIYSARRPSSRLLDTNQSLTANPPPTPPSATYLSEIEASILRSANPIELNETEEITVLGERGIWANKEEALNWRGALPLCQYILNEDANPEVIDLLSKFKIYFCDYFYDKPRNDLIDSSFFFS